MAAGPHQYRRARLAGYHRLVRSQGHTLRVGRVLGATETIEMRDGLFYGAADPRRPAARAVGIP